ncbi:MAG: DUF1761 domain-containing protein [Acidimicrobiia bacterium]|nr:DUF1761 domain-containing protein [Acidimicrobiia bacterium]
MRTFDGFFDILGELDWLAIIVATLVVGVVLAMIFYGPLFGRKWAAGNGVEYSMKFNPKTDIPGFIVMFIFQIGVAYLGAYDDIEHSLVTALVVGILLIAPVLYARVLWAKGSRVGFFIDTAFYFFAIAIGGYVQGLMA